MSGTGHIAVGYPNDIEPDFNRHPEKKPTVIDRAWETGRSTTFKIKATNLGSLPCPQEEHPRASENGFNWQRQFVMLRAYRNWRKKLPNISAKQSDVTH
jgi:hypothetical protein